ncbi:hypothetical protein KDX38_10965 [Pseudomonas sp. CDFA 602]|uniref:hypothetical protein n=1 Tax=Pseudomonas californiensis TaxID=2829823 RepID=UPI001E453329|nr:hypothetical protein [Pseudomonas californiensis]MCD5994162.1 hypothetical protein [Pseudomonas californiensis]MCD5999739.1 hypothetical protein [Pseudomonas californiensis]
MNAKALPDWELIETLYRAGILSVREIAASQGITHGAINKRAKRDSWVRDLKVKIKARADALVSRAAVSMSVSTDTRVTEQQVVAANADLTKTIRLEHRSDIGRNKTLTIKLLEELESLSDNRELFARLGELIASVEEGGDDGPTDAYEKMQQTFRGALSLPSRVKMNKELSETLRVLVTLERQAYGIDDNPEEETFAQRMDRLMGDQ